MQAARFLQLSTKRALAVLCGVVVALALSAGAIALHYGDSTNTQAHSEFSPEVQDDIDRILDFNEGLSEKDLLVEVQDYADQEGKTLEKALEEIAFETRHELYSDVSEQFRFCDGCTLQEISDIDGVTPWFVAVNVILDVVQERYGRAV
ncbi:hypothetical protein [Jonesia quinghaiensis]|uniref:hypothetical protein n=1 Tax=Jonesia quinghaiensis TaxID=262806 RepID=UPI00040E9460|nr:hypothetical protein [Jonesia quinghaiensis]